MAKVVAFPQTVFGELLGSWERHLRAENRSPRTIHGYQESARQLISFQRERGATTDPIAMMTHDIETFIAHLIATRRPTTAAVRFRSLQQLFRWLADEGEIESSPMGRMKVPMVPEQPVPFLREDDLRRLIKECEAGTDFLAKRDTAIVRIFVDCGVRLSELATLRYDPIHPDANDVGMEQGLLRVVGKGGRQRVVPIGAKATRALDRYLRARARHSHAKSNALWLANRGPMTSSGIAQAIKGRAAQVGVQLHPHQLRHGWAHALKASGASDSEVMVLGGWRSPAMLRRYGSALEVERAFEMHRRLSPGDRL